MLYPFIVPTNIEEGHVLTYVTLDVNRCSLSKEVFQVSAHVIRFDQSDSRIHKNMVAFLSVAHSKLFLTPV